MSKLFNYNTNEQWDYENGFYITSHPTRIAKMIAHYELYKSIINLPGCLIECGVLKGASLIRFATFRDILESPYSRKIIGFDAFGHFPDQDNHDDQRFAEEFERAAGPGISIEQLDEVFKHKSIGNYELIQGDIIETVPQYLKKHPEIRIALLHIDVDVYRPTLTILEHLFDRVVKNGLIVFDDYGTVEGETRALEEYLLKKRPKVDLYLEKLPVSHIPVYIKKSI